MMKKDVGPAKLYVLKRDGRHEDIHFDKITRRVQNLCNELNPEFVDPVKIAMEVIGYLYPGVTTAELDNIAAETAVGMISIHPDYEILAARLAISNLQKETKNLFSEVISDLYTASQTKNVGNFVSSYHYNLIMEHADQLDNTLIYENDFKFNYFAFKALENSCLLKINGRVVERPQHMFMRVAIGIHGEDIDAVIETYKVLTDQYFIHDTSILLKAATQSAQLFSSCLVAMKEDSIEGIFSTLKTCALIASAADDIGVHMHCIRAMNSYIAGTNGISNGLAPMLRVYDTLPDCVDNGYDKRLAKIMVYIEPWHADIFEFLELKKNTGKEEIRARELFYGLWIPDEFMRRVEKDEQWSLMCPHECPGLSDSYGEEFEKLYTRFETDKCYVRQVSARNLFFAILDSQMETGMPSILYKDACNRKSNQKNLGTIKCSNFSANLVEYTSSDEIAVGNFASIAVNRFVNEDRTYNFNKLLEITKIVTKNLNKIIDITSYPVDEAVNPNLKHRPIGISIQGLADLFISLRQPYECEESQMLNKQIFETIYYAALDASCELAQKFGSYDTYPGSPISNGILQFDMWGVTPTPLWNWNELKEKIKKHGVRNSLLLAPMATGTTSRILGNSESFDPYQSYIFSHRVHSVEIQVVNRHLLHDLFDRELWDKHMKNELIQHSGSVQNIERIPEDLKQLYKTAWDISQKPIMQMAADRAAFIDQSQSLSIYIAEPNFAKLSSMHFYGWKLGLKTGMHYLKTNMFTNTSTSVVEKVKDKPKIANDEISKDMNDYNERTMVCSL